MKELLFFIIGCIFMFFIIEIRKNCYIHNSNYRLLKEKINILVRQASRWSTAAKQDNNSMIAVLHANYGAGYLWALKDIATNTQISNATGINMVKFEKEIIETQDKATMRMAQICEKYAPPQTYLTKLGGEGF